MTFKIINPLKTTLNLFDKENVFFNIITRRTPYFQRQCNCEKEKKHWIEICTKCFNEQIKKVKVSIIAAANPLQQNSKQIAEIASIKITPEKSGSLLYWSVRKILT